MCSRYLPSATLTISAGEPKDSTPTVRHKKKLWLHALNSRLFWSLHGVFPTCFSPSSSMEPPVHSRRRNSWSSSSSSHWALTLSDSLEAACILLGVYSISVVREKIGDAQRTTRKKLPTAERELLMTQTDTVRLDQTHPMNIKTRPGLPHHKSWQYSSCI